MTKIIMRSMSPPIITAAVAVATAARPAERSPGSRRHRRRRHRRRRHVIASLDTLFIVSWGSTKFLRVCVTFQDGADEPFVHRAAHVRGRPLINRTNCHPIESTPPDSGNVI